MLNSLEIFALLTLLAVSFAVDLKVKIAEKNSGV